MGKLLVSHETPLCLLEESRNFNDYDYALVHLFENYPQYKSFFQESLKQGREVILDNSLFELGKAWDSDLFIKEIEDLNPTYYIIPDSFDDYEGTIELFDNFLSKKCNSRSKKIGVIHGSSLQEYKMCYEYIEPYVDVIAISFGYSFYSKLSGLSKDIGRSVGRYMLLDQLLQLNIIKKDKRHHLLGISLPQELFFYKSSRFNFIKSIDTSSPVIHGLNGIEYQNMGLEFKLGAKMIDFFEEPLKNKEIIYKNINLFKSFANL